MHWATAIARRRSWIPIALGAALAGLAPAPAHAWPGAHTTLTCTDCHATEPDPAADTADTVLFVVGDLTGTCLLCRPAMRDAGGSAPLALMASLSAATVVRHRSSGVVPQAMYEHFSPSTWPPRRWESPWSFP